MDFYTAITALTVSLDSFFCGFSFSEKNKSGLGFSIGVSLTVLCMCFIALFQSESVTALLGNGSELLGGAVLCLIGIINFVDELRGTNSRLPSLRFSRPKNKTGLMSICGGFAVGIDGAVATLSLAVSGRYGIFLPFLIAFFHFVFVASGIAVSKFARKTVLLKYGYAPPLAVVMLGAYKIAQALF